MSTKKATTWWKRLIQIAIGLILAIGTSKIATKDPTIDSAVKAGLNQAGEVIINTLSQAPEKKDTTIAVF